MKLLFLKNPIIKVEYDFILIIIKRLIKYIILVFYYKSSTAKQLAYVFLKEVISRYKLLVEILLNKNKLFTFKF